mgnify:CR=1 FL=1
MLVGKHVNHQKRYTQLFWEAVCRDASHFAIKPILGDAVDIHALFHKAKSFISYMFIFVEF